MLQRGCALTGVDGSTKACKAIIEHTGGLIQHQDLPSVGISHLCRCRSISKGDIRQSPFWRGSTTVVQGDNEAFDFRPFCSQEEPGASPQSHAPRRVI